MPRRFWRRLVPLLALSACALPHAGASAAPLDTPDPPLPRDERRAEDLARTATLRALVDRRERHRAHAARESRRALRVVDVAGHQVGTGYAYGGGGPGGFDCSGLTAYAFARVGVELPHNSHAQAALGEPVARGDIRPGDLVFFSTAGAGASHVGIATGRTTAVSATSSGGVLEHPTNDDYWGGHYVTARRVL
jgi:cell wall-associated NlpC family hydrolase